MKFDNDRDRYKHGMDIGTIVEGTVINHEGKFVIIDEDAIAFDPQMVLSTLEGKKIRLTMVSFETLENIERSLGGG
jgi:hypothetical protein